MKTFSSILALLIWFTASCTTDQLSISDLKCEYLEDPCGIDIQNPRLSWKIFSESNGQAQTAYHILVASSEKLLADDKGDLWNTGRIESDQSVHIVYRGEKLEPRDQAFWKVRIWDRNGKPSLWSRTATWEMGLTLSEWQAKWIGLAQYTKVKHEEINPAIHFRKRTEFSREIKKARAYISGLGYYELHINGKKVGDHVLSPNHTNYDRRQSPVDFDESAAGNMSTRVLYETWDITSSLRQGENIFKVCLGNGWYFQNERKEDLPYSYDTPRFIAQFEIEFADGTQKRIVSDSSWESSSGPILHNGIYSGEIYDARLEDKSWGKTKAVRPPTGRLTAQISPPDRVTRIIKPVSMTMPAEGVYRYDLGEMISGWAKLKIAGPRGTAITMKFIEEAGPSYGQTDSYILKGKGPETWEPRFTWHAFRYIDVSSPFPLTLDNITGVVVNTDVTPAGSFQSSNELFNTILENFRRTQLGNMHGGIPSDCPHRERRGYTGDGQIAAQAAIFNFDMASFYTKWMHDLQDAQNATNGYVPNTVPYQSGGGGTAWGSAYIIIPWYMYLYYGDESILEQHYSGMKKWIDYLTHLTDGSGIINEEKLGEWVPPDVTEIPPSLVSTAYYYHVLHLMTEIAAVLKKMKDSAYFQDLAIRTKQAFNRKYYRESDKSYSIGRQGANVFALGFGLVPENRIMDVFKSLVRNIASNTDEHFDTGMMGTPLVLDVLTRYGRVDLAYSMMNQHDYPSFGYAIDNGATTIWETWRGDASHSHPMFGSVCQWFYQALAGINPDPEHPGFRNIIINPRSIRNLEYARASYESVYGTIESGWEWEGNDLDLKLTVPVNSTATVVLPAADPDDVTINHRTEEDCRDVSFVESGDSVVKYQVGSGKYEFISKNARNLVQISRLSVPGIIPADSVLFLPDRATVRIHSGEENAVIRYTLNGDEPDERSPVYSEPLKISSNAIIKAKAFRDGYKPSSYKTSSLAFVDPDINGLRYQYYEGNWERVPDFTSMEPVRAGVIYEIGLDLIPFKADQFGLVLKGTIEIPAAGLYTFYLNSNDGSKLYIDGKLIIDNDGLHGALEKQGQIKLSKGKQSLQITYFQAGGGFHLKAYFSGPDSKRVSISPSMLFRYDNTNIFHYKTNTFIKNWLLCGPFPNCENCSSTDFIHGEHCYGFYTDYLESMGGEKNAVPHAGMALKYPGLKKDMKWFSCNSITDKITLNDILSPNDMVVAYAFCKIKSTDQQKTILALGSNDGIQVFLNRKKIHENHPRSGRWLQQDNDYVPVELEKGVNNLMLKIDEGTGDFGFMARFLDYDSTLTSLSKDIDKHKELKLLYYNDTLVAQFGSPYKIATLNPGSKVTLDIIHETAGKLGERTVTPGTETVFGLENTPDGFLTTRASFPLSEEDTIVSEARYYKGKLLRHKSPGLLNKDLLPLLETGRPFFPIGTYGAPPEDYNLLKEAGYNFVVASAEKLDKVYEAGLMAAGPVHENIRELLNHYKEHPAVLTWMLYDEPGYNRADILKIYELYETAYEVDPRHPSYLVITDPKVYETFGRCCDILSVDTYPVAHGVISDVGKNIARAYKVSEGDQPVWHCGQLFSWPGQRIPTIREHRFMTYIALIKGAKGLLWYTYKGYGQYLPDDYPELWEAHKKLLKEIDELSPLFMTVDPFADIELTEKQPDIKGIFLKSAIGWYIIAANQSTTDSFSPGFIIGPGYAGEISVIGENRSIKAENGHFRDGFRPLDVHIYKLSVNSGL